LTLESENCCQEERFSQERLEAKHINSPNHDFVNKVTQTKTLYSKTVLKQISQAQIKEFPALLL